MSQLTKLQRLVVLERQHEARRAEITTEQAALRAWWQKLSPADRDHLLKTFKATERQMMQRRA